MDQQTVTSLLIVVVAATVILIAVAITLPRLTRRDAAPIAAASSPAATGAGTIRMYTTPDATRSGDAGSERAAEGDALTGLLGPQAWGRVVADEDARVRRYRRPATIVMVELDGLDRLIERLGDAAADRLVPAVADTIRRHAREADFVARLDTGRFAILLPETDEVRAINYVERIRRACDLWLESGAVALRLAIGWASASGDDSLHDAGRAATERMFAEVHRNARRSGDLAAPVPDGSDAGGAPGSRPVT
jgi:diguanylate cyclase (GGDEF)-like protein